MKSDVKKTVKFIGKCALCLVPAAALILYTLLCPMCYMDEEYPAWKYTKEVVSGKIGESYYDTVILGDSVGMSSIIPDEISDDGAVNLSVGGGTGIEMYFFMRQYLQNHEAPKNVVILFGPYHYWKIDTYKMRTVYFRALSSEEARGLYEMAENLGSYSVCFDDYMMYELSCRCGLPTVYMPAITASDFTSRYQFNNKRYTELIEDAGYGLFGNEECSVEPSYEASYASLDFDGDSGLVLYYLKELINLCKDNGCDVKLIQPAQSEATFEALNENYVSDYYKVLDEIAADNPDIYIEKELRCYGNEFFGDVSHLNENGAKKFSAEVRGILNKTQ